jgi:hypothetical protein
MVISAAITYRLITREDLMKKFLFAVAVTMSLPIYAAGAKGDERRSPFRRTAASASE